MTSIPVPPERVAERVRQLRRKRPQARVFGIYYPWTWTGSGAIKVDGADIPVAHCETPLAVSTALTEAEADQPLVLLVGVGETELAQDVLARLAGRGLDKLDPWGMVCEHFQAFGIDPRVTREAWMAGALLQSIPKNGYPPAPTGLLDLDTVWKHLLGQYLDLPDGRPDADRIMAFSMASGADARLARLEPDMRRALHDRVAQTGGATAATMVDAALAGNVQWLMPIGIVSEILFGSDPGDPVVSQAVARLERFTGGQTLPPEIGSAWFQAASRVLADLEDERATFWLSKGEHLSREVKVTEHVAQSGLLPAGFEARLSILAASIQQAVGGTGSLASVESAFDRAAKHREGSRQRERLERAHMAVRLVRYLASSGGETAASLSASSKQYLDEGRFVDWARSASVAGDANADLSQAITKLATAVQARRDAQNKCFAEHLAKWHLAPAEDADLFGIEHVMAKVVALIAKERPVLLLVLDGMSHAVMRALSESFEKDRWLELEPASQQSPAVLGVVPSVTELSRASLLAGALTRGGAADERKMFASQPELLAASSGSAPILFHKGDVWTDGDSSLASEIREATDDSQRRIVAVVLNAIDDSLSGSDQLRLTWTVEAMRHLDALLYHARSAGRAVIVTSDHGHVFECGSGTRALPSDSDQERWRDPGTPLLPEEIEIEGSRVSSSLGRPRVVVPWSEKVRYGRRKNGYHGGATLQEVMVPLSVFVAADMVGETEAFSLAGWKLAPDQKPGWWFATRSDPVDLPTPKPAAKASKPAWQETPLFEKLEAPAVPASEAWIERLLESDTFEAQRTLAGKVAPDVAKVRQILTALSRRGGHAARRVLAGDVGQPEFRLRSLIASLQRVLNVDGYPILAMDDAAGAVNLDKNLLMKQFQISEAAT